MQELATVPMLYVSVIDGIGDILEFDSRAIPCIVHERIQSLSSAEDNKKGKEFVGSILAVSIQ
jgi:hypothetical protein